MNKGIQKKTPSKLYLNTNSNLKGQAQKNDLLSSTEESTKEQTKPKDTNIDNLYLNNCTPTKNTFFKAKDDVKQIMGKDKYEIGSYGKHKQGDKGKQVKKNERKQTIFGKYNDYFDTKNQIRGNKGKGHRYDAKLSDSGESVNSINSINSIQSQGCKNIIKPKYQIESKKQPSCKGIGEDKFSFQVKNKNLVKTNKYGVNKNTNNFQTKSTGGEEELIRAKNHQKEDIMGFKDRSVSKFTYQNKASTKSTQATVKKKQKESENEELLEGKQKNRIEKEEKMNPLLMLYKNSEKTKNKERKITPVKIAKKIEAFKTPQQKLNKNEQKLKNVNFSDSIQYKKSPEVKGKVDIMEKMEKKVSILNMMPMIESEISIQRNMKLPNKTITLISVSESSSPEMVTLSIHKKIVEHELTTVYICYHEGTHTLYCLKKCLIKPDILNQLIIEGKIGSQLNHPNLVKTYCTLYDKNHLYFLMEYLEEGTLLSKKIKQKETSKLIFGPQQVFDRQRIKTYKPLQTDKINVIRQTLKQLLEGLSFIHKKGIIHRDIKPQNIYISHDTYKIGDFGSSTYTNSQEYIGTLDYASPQIMQKLPYNNLIDMWSIGCIAYELDVGKPPFYHVQRNQTIKKIIKCDYDSLLVTNAELKDLIRKLLVLAPHMRMSAQQALRHPFLNFNIQKRTRI